MFRYERPPLIALDRKFSERRGLFVASRPHDPLISGWRFGLRRTRCGRNLSHSVSRRLVLRGAKSLCRIDTPGLWQPGALAGDYRRRTGLQRSIRKEQRRYQRQTYPLPKR